MAVRPQPQWKILLGFALMVPAVVFLIRSYIEPAIWVVRTSFEDLDATTTWSTRVTESGSSYSIMLSDGFGKSMWFAATLACLPLLGVLLGLCMGWWAQRCGPLARRLLLSSLTLPAAAFVPCGLAAAWRVARLDHETGMASDAEIRWAWGLTWLGLTCAITVLLTGAVLRSGRGSNAGSGRPLILVVVIATLSVVAASLQEFTFPFLLGGSDATSSTTPLLKVFTVGFQRLSFGPAAAGSVMLLIPLAAIGGAITWLVIRFGIRLEMSPNAEGRAAQAHLGEGAVVRPIPAWNSVVLGAMAGGVLTICGYALWPWFNDLLTVPASAQGETSSGDLLANTWLPTSLSTGIGVTAALSAAFGIAVLRPLGDRSELLLWPFAPFLVVGPGPLALRFYAAGATVEQHRDLLGLVPPVKLVVPALLLFTLLLRGQRIRAGSETTWRYSYLYPVMPTVIIVTLATWVVSAQDLLWPLLSGVGSGAGSAGWATGPIRLVESLESDPATLSAPAVSVAMPGWIVLLVLTVLLWSWLTYFDRMTVRIGDQAESTT